MRFFVFFALTGCSLIFDPSKVASSGCPVTPERCSPPDHARAVCADSACSFECLEGFRDADGLPENGCEATCALLVSPGSLTVTSRPDGTSLDWAFPIVANAKAYRLCTSVAAGAPTCVTVEVSSCGASTCQAQTTGHPTRVQVFGQVQALNACDAPSAEAMATGFTQRTAELTSWGSDSSCMPMPSVSGDVLAVEQSAFCSGSAPFGEELWRSGTFEVELRPAGMLGPNAMGGLVFSSGTRRIGVLIGVQTIPVGQGSTIVRESRNSAAWQFLATSGSALVPDQWNRLRVVVKGEVWSVSLAKPNEPLREVLRYHDSASTNAPWRPGLHVLTPNLFAAGRMEFRNLTTSSSDELPPTGPSSQSWTFSVAGAQPAVRTTGTVGTQLRYEPCPGFPAATACTGQTMCTPAAGATCARVSKGAISGGTLTFDLPTGLDTRQPWNLRFRFAPAADGGFSPGAALAFAAQGALLESENALDGGVRGVNGRWGQPLFSDTWNVVDYRFDPAAMTWTARLNGQLAMPASARFPPPAWDKHVGAVMIGGQNLETVELWLSDLSISQ